MKDLFDTVVSSINWKVGKFNTLPVVLGLLMSSLDVLMMTLGKYTSKGRIPFAKGLTLGTLAYSVEPYLFFKSLGYESMTTMNLIWDLTSDILVTILGVFWFGESIKGIRWIAVLFALVSLGLFAYTDA